ncbi:hypothetical protein ACGFX4_28580 [Kitasatospora sp. NPDC048365]|uniref:hypothetical protein n=1 Tax=Kitasatospora sp. NPDC048365 TaxID=3364050 RepID=UPI0037120B0A
MAVLLVMTLAACGTGGGKKKKRNRSTSTSTPSSTASGRSVDVTVLPETFTVGRDLTVSFYGCGSADTVEFRWRDVGTGRSGVLGAQRCSNSTATLVLRGFAEASPGHWEVTGKAAPSGLSDVAVLTVQAR